MEVVDYCSRNKLQLIVGCDASAYHIMRRSTDINLRRECLLEYLVRTNLNILNKSNKPTFIISKRKVMDLKLGTDKTGDLVTNWHVSDEISWPNPSVLWLVQGPDPVACHHFSYV